MFALRPANLAVQPVAGGQPGIGFANRSQATRQLTVVQSRHHTVREKPKYRSLAGPFSARTIGAIHERKAAAVVDPIQEPHNLNPAGALGVSGVIE